MRKNSDEDALAAREKITSLCESPVTLADILSAVVVDADEADEIVAALEGAEQELLAASRKQQQEEENRKRT